MGFYIRRSVNFGPLRVNLSKSGVGFSVGGPGFRTGVRSNGRRYSRVSIPGTGVGYEQSHRTTSGTGCALYLALIGTGSALATWAAVSSATRLL